MRSFLIVKLDVMSYPLAQRTRVFEFIDVDAFVLKRAEESLSPTVICCPTLAVHRDLNASLLQELKIIAVGKMRALVAVHDFRLTAAKCPFKALEYEALLERAGQLIINHLPAVPVDDEKQIHKAFTHPEIGDVDSPDLIRPINCQAVKQVGTRVGSVKALAQIWLRIDRFKPHDLHQSAHALAIDHKVLIAKNSRHASIAVVGMLHVDLVDPVHESDILFTLTLLFGRTVDTRPIHTEQLCLAFDRDIRIVQLHHRFSRFKRFI